MYMYVIKMYVLYMLVLSAYVRFCYSNEYQIFNKIVKLDYEYPDGFDANGRDLVEKLLVSANMCSVFDHCLQAIRRKDKKKSSQH